MAHDNYKAKMMGKSYSKENEKYMKGMKGMKGKEFKNVGPVEMVSTQGEKYDLKRLDEYSAGTQGYPSKAFDYEY